MRSRDRLWLSFLSLLAAGSMAQASSVGLLGLRTQVDRQGTTLTLQLPTRVAYAPSQIGPRLFVLDMVGVSTDRPSESQPVDSPLVRSYRLLQYQGADNKPHLALEITLKAEANIRPTEVPEGLQVRVASTAQPAVANPFKPLQRKAASLREVSVAESESESALEVEIVGDGKMQYRTLWLPNPDRLVVDLPDVINRIRQQRLEVNTSPLKSVRIAQMQRQPLITRVVMDLERKVPFQVRPESNRLVVSLGSLGSQKARAGETARTPGKGEPAKLPEPKAASVESPASKLPVAEVAGAAAGEFVEEKGNEDAASPMGAFSGGAESVLMASNRPTVVVPPSKISSPNVAGPADRSAASSVRGAAASISPAQSLTAVAANASELSASTPAPTGEVSSEPPEPVLLAQQTPAPAGAAATPAAQQPAYTGEPISVNLKDVDLKDFFRLIHEISGLNVVLDPGVSGVVTIVLDEVPWDQAMDIVMRNSQLEKQVVGNVVRIARVSTLEAEAKAQLAKAQAEALMIQQAQPQETVTRPLSYAKAADLVPTLKRFLSQRGDLTFDARTNTLIIYDIPGVMPAMDRLIRTLDQKSLQVEIEARVVAASRSFARDIGVQLAASGESGRIILGGAGLVGESPLKRGVTPPLFIGTPPDPPEPGKAPKFANVAQPLISNFPAVGATSGSTFVLTTPTFALDAIITAAERRGVGKLLSRPKIITQNNVEALVKQGVRIPIQTVINNTVTVTFIDVVLRLTVTPQITADGTIFLKTDVENTTIDPGIARINGVPALDTQQATTQVLVSNGGTIFFGGVIQTTNTSEEQQVPLLGSIPLVGNLFRRKATSSTTNELLFFVTPKIVQS